MYDIIMYLLDDITRYLEEVHQNATSIHSTTQYHGHQHASYQMGLFPKTIQDWNKLPHQFIECVYSSYIVMFVLYIICTGAVMFQLPGILLAIAAYPSK